MLTAAVRTLRGGALARLGSAGAGASGWMSRLGCSGVALQGQIHTHTLRATAVEASMRPAWGRGFTASAARLGAEDFFTPFFDRKATPENEKDMLVGKAWECKQLRLKSFDDLHKLWYVMLKEQNALYTERYHAKRLSQTFEKPRRLTMVRLGMNRIKQVLTQRAIEEAKGHEDRRKVMMRIINGPPHRSTAHRNQSYPSVPWELLNSTDPVVKRKALEEAGRIRRVKKSRNRGPKKLPHFYRRPYKFELKHRKNKLTMHKGL